LSNPTGQKIAPAYFPNLDALRFMAAFSVFVFHYFRDIRAFYPGIEHHWLFDKILMISDKGGLGVNFFFVLSGFLITYLILQEKAQTGHFSLWKFLVRRTLRIWPVYFIVVGIGFVIFPAIFDTYYTLHNVTWYLFFLANFDEIYRGMHDPVNFLTAPWSVAVEEQFYLFWSLALFPLLKIKLFRLEYLILILYLASFWFRWINRADEHVIYYHTFSVCQDILTGAFIGLSLFRGRTWINNLTQFAMWKIALIYLTGFLLCIAKNKVFAGDFHVAERFILSLFFGFIILDQSLGKNSVIKLGKYNWLNYLGKISYGFYMYHLIVMFVLCRLIENYLPTGYYLIPLYFVMALAGTILSAALSFKFLEAPLLKLKPKRS
jgi:peptidoglycan/LPS O-acetylase OafA/YrhL